VTRPSRLRSLLFAPANRPELAPKLARSGADGVVLDLEDAVPTGEKDAARAVVGDAAATIVGEPDCPLVFVRVNAVPTTWFAADVAAAAAAGVEGIVVPKLETVDELDVIIGARRNAGRDDLAIVAGIESALGVERARVLLASGAVAAAYFGAEDYVADLGGVRTESSTEVLYARSRVVLATRLAGITALDQVVVAYEDDDRFRADAAAGRALGFRGKLCIHPRQVPLANEVFGVSAEQAERARRIIDAYEEARRRGAGVVSVDGQMVDEPMVRLARAVLAETD
jgi:citrate lyase subunit beta/citryl-CoA lyase